MKSEACTTKLSGISLPAINDTLTLDLDGDVSDTSCGEPPKSLSMKIPIYPGWNTIEPLEEKWYLLPDKLFARVGGPQILKISTLN